MNTIFLLALALVPGQAPALACAKPVVDLGSIRGGPALTQTFEVVNRGDVDVQIVHAQPSCGCLAPRFSATRLRPGDSAAVEVSINTITQPEGDNLWSVRLFYRAAGSDANQLLDLQVRAKLTREVSLQPANLRLAGKPGLTHEITLTDRRAKPLEVTSLAVSSNRIAVLDDGGWQSAAVGWARKFKVRITADCPAGRHEEFVQLFSRDADYRDMRVTVNVSRTDKTSYLVTPGEAKLALEAGKPAAETIVLLRDQEGRPVEIDSVDADDAALTYRFTEGAQPTAMMRVGIKPGQTPARWSNVRVRIKAPVAQTVVVPVSCRSDER